VSSRSGVERQDLVLFSSERESWAQERNRLEKTESFERRDSLRFAAGSDRSRSGQRGPQGERLFTTTRLTITADASRAHRRLSPQRMYGKYLRAESFRKALIYQKKYLLLLLGGFQECEEATLSLIARMGGHPAHTCLEGFTRFRSAVRVSIALS
ncbi:hypothetical protein M9458_039054, partial [Cirrhinus mrigala]